MIIGKNNANESFGCVFCKTGKESSLLQNLTSYINGATFLVAKKQIRRRINGQSKVETVIMFPGYIFFKAYNDIKISNITKQSDVLKVLSGGDGCWKLKGTDYDFALWLFSHNGVIGFSKAVIVDDKLKIIEGPLLGYDDEIIKVNRRFQSCLVKMKFDGNEIKIWLGYEIVE